MESPGLKIAGSVTWPAVLARGTPLPRPAGRPASGCDAVDQVAGPGQPRSTTTPPTQAAPTQAAPTQAAPTQAAPTQALPGRTIPRAGGQAMDLMRAAPPTVQAHSPWIAPAAERQQGEAA
jgi:hypothetical protein